MALHKNLVLTELHAVHALTYVNAGLRTGATGLTLADEGKIAWQLDDDTFWVLVNYSPVTWVIVSAAGIALHMNKVEISVKKASPGTLAVGKVVYATGWNDTDPSDEFAYCELAKADAVGTLPAAGIVSAQATDTVEGKMLVVGVLHDVDTSGFSVGNPLYLSASVAGAFTNVPPSGPNITQTIGVIAKVHATAGHIGVNILSYRPIQYVTPPAAVGTAACGTSNQASASDHVHAHGSQNGGSLHAVATGVSAGFESAADKTNLDAATTHLGRTDNPHSVTQTQVGLSGVTNDAQLKRAANDFSTFTEKTTPVAADLIIIEDSAAAGVKKKVQVSNIPAGVDSTAIHKVTAGEISAMTEKTAPVAADLLVIEDSAATNAKKKVQIGNLPHKSVLIWGNSNVSATTGTRYMSPGYTDATAGTTALQFRVPTAGTLKNLYIRQNTAAGNGNAIVYTVRKNGVLTALTASVASTDTDGSDVIHTVDVAQGDLLDIEVYKAISLGTSPSNILVTMEVA